MRWTCHDRPTCQALLIAAVAALAVGRATPFHAPPRFDGAGYSVLGAALAGGHGYREIDRPGAPRHAHFPPGYPAALALLWGLAGRSSPAAHALSAAFTAAAAVAAWAWFRSWVRSPRVAFLAGLAVALNWTWARNGGGIQSEPLFLLLEQLALLAALRASGDDSGAAGAAALGTLLAACVLTRHVGVALLAAVLLDLLLRGKPRAAATAAAAATALLLPWIAWLATVREHTQAALLVQGGLARRVAALALFYVRRIPDQLAGPFVETATVFRASPALAFGLNLWAAAATGVVLLGWARALRLPDRRLAGLVGGATLAVLLVWPFTEAGRFLVPLVPCLVVGATEGLALLIEACGRERPREWAALAVLAISAPYSIYALATDRAAAQQRTHADFDAACAWIATRAEAPGPVLTRHPGEVFWQTGRQALDPPGDSPAALRDAIDRSAVAYLLIDADRYANAPESPLEALVRSEPGKFRLAWLRGAPGGPAVSVYEVLRPPFNAPRPRT